MIDASLSFIISPSTGLFFLDNSPEHLSLEFDFIVKQQNIMSASTRIPPIAQPFVSERAKKTLDQVYHLQPSQAILFSHLILTPQHPSRSNNSSKENVSPPKRSSRPSWVKVTNDGPPTQPSWKPSRPRPASKACGTCSCPRTTSPRALDSATSNTV